MKGPVKIIRGPAEGRTFGVVGHRYRLLATGDETAGRYAIFEAAVPPGDGPPPHEHANEEESFYVVEGTIGFIIEGRRIDAEAGTFVAVPRGTVHTYFNPGRETARLLVQVNPAGLEKFFQAVGVPMADPTGDPPPSTVAHLDRVLAAAPKYGMKIHIPTEA